ncbi:MAG: CRISPR-associated helicase Cas3' [Chloroflexota bacterium]|nr:CRISPR-associated helicase Cas3' [Chloroflexota bacterium]
MTASRWPDWLDDIWAKSAERGAGGQPERLALHTWAVLERLTDLIRLRPELPQTLGVPRLWHILFWAAFLHDFGKAASGFQALLRGGERWPHRHEVLSLAFLDWIADGLTSDEQSWVAAAIVSHHKDAAEIRRLYAPPDDLDDDQLSDRVAEMDEATLRGLWRWLAECSAAWIDELGLGEAGVMMPAFPNQDQAVARVQQEGVARIYHWLKIYRRFVRRIERSAERALIVGTLLLRGHLVNADHSASAHAGPLPHVHFDADAILASRELSRDKLFKHQSMAETTTGSAVLTAPTGSGKTEAALLWATHQAAISGGLPRLFYTLPYQASMNAMKIRLEESFPGKVGLQHGRSLLALYRMLMEQKYNPAAAAGKAKWARNLVKLNYPPVRVFSPYQMLKGMYRLKGYEAMLTDYYEAAFIFDEIHAYEVERLALILKTIEYLAQNYHARFIVMSATFPTLIKDWLRDALGNTQEITAEPVLFDDFKRHRLVLLAGELLSDEGLARIVNDARAGKSVLVVCNLVARAQTAYRELRARLAGSCIPVELLHGRFTVRDRLDKEKLVRDATGATSKQRRPIVLVATQVVEVSLDIDLDTIYTDPAPLEALVQRFGRINRRRKQPDLAPVHVYRQPNDGQKIYDQELVARTLVILDREKGRPLDESAVGKWLDEIYSGEVAKRWQERYSIAASEFAATCIRPLRAFDADESLKELFYQAFDGLDVLPISLQNEYKQLKEAEPIRANELLVSISYRRYRALLYKGQVLPHVQGKPYTIRATYNSEIGLTFDAPDRM